MDRDFYLPVCKLVFVSKPKIYKKFVFFCLKLAVADRKHINMVQRRIWIMLFGGKNVIIFSKNGKFRLNLNFIGTVGSSSLLYVV
jgi:hypothetical protein